VNVGLSSSDVGFDYVLFQDGSPIATLSGSGASLDFGLQTAAATYTIMATDLTTGCMNTRLPVI
jgi:hypothetical protein